VALVGKTPVCQLICVGTLLADHLLIWRVDHISPKAGRPVTPTKLLGLRHFGGFSETLFADAGDHLIGRRVLGSSLE
jgi:hypothetical protein